MVLDSAHRFVHKPFRDRYVFAGQLCGRAYIRFPYIRYQGRGGAQRNDDARQCIVFDFLSMRRPLLKNNGSIKPVIPSYFSLAI